MEGSLISQHHYHHHIIIIINMIIITIMIITYLKASRASPKEVGPIGPIVVPSLSLLLCISPQVTCQVPQPLLLVTWET